MEIRKIFNKFKTERPKVKDVRTEKVLYTHIEIFISFLFKIKSSLKDFVLNSWENYFLHLTLIKNSLGLTPDISWYCHHFIYLNIFFNWLAEKRYIDKNPLPPNSNQWIYPIMKDKLKQRLTHLQSINLNKISIDKLLTEYFENFNIYFTSRYKIRTNFRVINWLKEFGKLNSKTILELNSKDTDLLIDFIIKRPVYSSKIYSYENIKEHLKRIEYFYKWCYTQGAILEHPLKDYTEHCLKERYNLYLNKNQRELKKRHYTIKEILRAYKKYLNKVLNSFVTIDIYYKALLFFIRFLISRDKTIYTVTIDTIESFKEYLLNYQFEAKQYYSPHFQARMLSRIKKFFNWCIANNYLLINPLQTYNATVYEALVADVYSKRKLKPHKRKKEIPKHFLQLYNDILEYEKNLYSPKTIKIHIKGWIIFFTYLDKIGIKDINKTDELVLNEYQIYLYHLKKRNGSKISINTVCHHLSGLSSLYKYLNKFNHLTKDPTRAITFPKTNSSIGVTKGLKNSELNKILELPNISIDTGIRDKSLLELLYSSGMRSNELCQLKIDNVDLINGLIKIDEAKGGALYQRIIPIGKLACYWIGRYIKEVRYRYVTKDTTHLFINLKGKAYQTQTVLRIVKEYCRKASIHKKKIVTHSFRVSCATEMIKKGADIKIIKDQLGHRSISSTEKYLRLMPTDLKKAHSKYHPRSSIPVSA